MPKDNELHKAAYKGEKVGVLTCVEDDNVPVDSLGAQDRTPLQRACGGGHKDILQLLVDKGANAKHTDKAGRSALHWCALSNAVDCAEILLKLGVDSNIKTKSGQTALHMACDSQKAEMVEFLLNAEGIDATLLNSENKSPYDIVKENASKELLGILKKHNLVPAGGGCTLL
eukprot:TRINITY_DN776188_c0_g1_i1.p1 TRINITY_DN776188_c0_g1~~TRINITY_DN776188_c0_g1_i1.p1  ORF type:complete len:172 (-),score=35.32 TRINITY_DN776188_c0_g1_i1:169-684(-)